MLEILMDALVFLTLWLGSAALAGAWWRVARWMAGASRYRVAGAAESGSAVLGGPSGVEPRTRPTGPAPLLDVRSIRWNGRGGLP